MIYQLELTFFGLTPEYKKIVLDEIFLLCYHGNGGWTHEEVYNMPIRYRHFYLHKINETIEKQNEAIEKQYNNTPSKSKEFVGPPDSVRKKIEQAPKADFESKVSKNKAPKK